MKRFFVLFVSLGLFWGAYAVPATIEEVFTGDTISVKFSDGENMGEVQKIRLANADSPESHGKTCDEAEKIAAQAENRAKALMPVNSVVEVKNIKGGTSGGKRQANIILSDGRDVGEILIKENLAHPFDGKHRKSWCK